MNGKNYTQPIELIANPNSAASTEDLKKQFDLAVAAYDDLNAIQSAILEIRQVQDKLGDVKKTLEGTSDPQVMAMLDRLEQRLDVVESMMIQKRAIAPQDPLAFPVGLNNQIASFARNVGVNEVAPTAQQYVEYDELKTMLATAMAAWNDVKATDIAKVNDILGGLKLEPISVAFTKPADYFHYAL